MSPVRAVPATEAPHRSFLSRITNFFTAPFRLMKNHPFSTAIVLGAVIGISLFTAIHILFPIALSQFTEVTFVMTEITSTIGGIGIIEFFRYVIGNRGARLYEFTLDGTVEGEATGISMIIGPLLVIPMVPLCILLPAVAIGIGIISCCVTVAGFFGLFIRDIIRASDTPANNVPQDTGSQNSHETIISLLTSSPAPVNRPQPPSLEERLTAVLITLDEAQNSYSKTARNCGQNPTVPVEYRLTAEDFDTIKAANDVITLTIMNNPVMLLPSGHSVDSESYTNIKSTNNRCPTLHSVVTKTAQNHTLKSIIISSIESIIVRSEIMISQLKNKEETMQKIKSDTVSIYAAPAASSATRRRSV
ncbi:MAG: hypothetical protein V4501_10165 [Pseudomonadota bacterium]